MPTPLSPANSPVSTAASEARTMPSPTFGVCAANRAGGSVEPSRTAAIGGTRVARRAGRMLATSVTSVPTTIERITVRGWTIVEASGSSRPRAAIRANMPLASPMPASSPSTDAIRPITKPSATTERMTCLREPPSVRSVANSRVRWATVIDRVLKITNAPTSSAMPPKPSRKYLTIDMLLSSSLASWSACLALSLTCSDAGISGDTARTSSAEEVPSFAEIEMVSKRPSRCSSFCAVLTSQAAMLANPSESTSPYFTTPVSSKSCFVPSVEMVIRSPIS